MRHGSTYDYFQRAFRRKSPGWAPLEFGPDGLCAGFRLEWRGARIAAAEYTSSTCATLMALCQHLAEAAAGLTLEEARGLSEPWLLAAHPDIPEGRRNRAELAARAFRSGLALRTAGDPA